ncbi:glutaredoxin family protein [Pallidibacillus thermolactis]|jgi:hypothetical protein|uniref:glutaredoxin family protein n=1 Tax=Pallidibacillus thermolactis TaxID=251051 RepID=UPI00156B0177|nr:glutaredoxin family protein [Pallidibacillus thermolactis]MCU9599944.1 glutaredoxin family protein [Pallidibacillus thermolactis subsp. kokeshiiformis]MED1672905.1 glutaredoxin family protein [Pallidibacillus thermolactis subsp. kokeshiiformis]
MVELILYAREGCHLCEEAELQLKVLQTSFPFNVKQIDIETDDQLNLKYGLSIPVIEYKGQVIQEGKIDTGKLILILQKIMEDNGCTI